MKRIVFLLLTIVTSVFAFAKDGDTFTASTTEGVSVLYQIISESDRTVRVGFEAVYTSDPAYKVAIDKDVTGIVTIPATVNGYKVVELGLGAFMWRAGITEVVLPEGLERVNYSFGQNSALRRFNIPSTVTSFVSQFPNCYVLESIVLPPCVTVIEDDQFAVSYFKSVTMPAGVTEIKKEAFLYNNGLQAIFMEGVTPPVLHETAFAPSFYDNVTVFVPSGSVEAYRQADVWKNFKNIRAFHATGDVFKWTDKTGVEFELKVTSATEKTVQIGSGSGPAIDPNFDGNINLPTFADGYCVTGIADNAFTACTKLTAVTANYYEPMAFSSGAFPSSLYSNGYLYVPEDLRPRYEAQSGWGAFQKVNPEQFKVGDYFTAKTVEGIDMKFYVCDAKKKYVRVDWEYYDNEVEHTIVHNVISKDTEGPVTIPDYALGYKVVAIGNFTFQKCTKITSVRIPDAVTKIGQDAFLSCSNLEQVNMPTSLVTIDDNAFYYCSKLKGPITIPEGVTFIGEDAFRGCSSLSGLTLPSTLTTLGTNAFRGCGALESLSIQGNSNYDSRDNCNALIETKTNTLLYGTANTVIPKSVTAIGSGAFTNNKTFTEIEVPAWITSIGSSAYYGCDNVSRITLNGCPTIAANAFQLVTYYSSNDAPARDCKVYALSTTPPSCVSGAFTPKNILYVPKGCIATYQAATEWQDFKQILDGQESPDNPTPDDPDPDDPEYEVGTVFTENTAEGVSISYVVLDKDARTVKVGSENDGKAMSTLTTGTVTIPTKVKGYTVVEVGKRAFYLCSKVSEIILPESVKTIGEGAFESSSITSFTFPSGVTAIADKTFYFCRSLTAITIPSGVTTIGDDAFSDCESLTSVSIPTSVQSLDGWAFSFCEKLEKVKVEWATPVSLSYGVFYGSTNATLYVPKGCKAAYEAADYWKDFKEIVEGDELPDEPDNPTPDNPTPDDPTPDEPEIVSFIAKTTEGVDVSYVVLDEEAKTVKVGTATNEIAIDEYTTGTVTIPSEVQGYKVVEIGSHAFEWAWKVQEIIIPSSVKTIAEHAFDCCRVMTTLTIPEGVTTIGDWAVSGCVKLTSVSIPASVTDLGGFVFSGSSALTSVKVGHTTPLKIDRWTFAKREDATLYVPAGCKAAYEAAECWQDFKEIVEQEVSVKKGDVNGDGAVDIADAVCIVNRVVGKATPVFYESAADLNRDGSIDIADAVLIVNYLVGKY